MWKFGLSTMLVQDSYLAEGIEVKAPIPGGALIAATVATSMVGAMLPSTLLTIGSPLAGIVATVATVVMGDARAGMAVSDI